MNIGDNARRRWKIFQNVVMKWQPQAKKFAKCSNEMPAAGERFCKM